MRLLAVFLTGILALLLYTLLWGPSSLHMRQERQLHAEQAQREANRFALETHALAVNTALLAKNDAAAVEEAARFEWGFIGENEVFYRLPR